MRKQVSIVLIEGEHVTRDLPGLLVGMGVWVKTTWAMGLAAALEQVTPHLIVCGDPAQLPLLKRTIAASHPGTPLLLISEWDLDRARRAITSGLVDDLIPMSMAPADIARRLETLASRRAQRAPSRATLTPPTRAGAHPLLSAGSIRPTAPSTGPAGHTAPPTHAIAGVHPSEPPRAGTAPTRPSLPTRSTGPRPSATNSAVLAASRTTTSRPPPPPLRGDGRARNADPAVLAHLSSVPPVARSVPPPNGHSGVSRTPFVQAPDSAPPLAIDPMFEAQHARRQGTSFAWGTILGIVASAAALFGAAQVEHTDWAKRVRSTAAERARLAGTWIQSASRKTNRDTDTRGPATRTGEPTGAAAPAVSPAPATLADAAPPSAAQGAAPQAGGVPNHAAELRTLFELPDSKEPGCTSLLEGWKPPAPLFDEDRPNHAAVHRREGQRFLMAGETLPALREFCMSAEIHPNGAGTEALASVYLNLRSFEQAERWANRLLERDPANVAAQELLGDIANQRGDVARSKDIWLGVLKVNPNQTAVVQDVAKRWVQDAVVALRASDLWQAERKLRRALALDPESPSAALLLSRALSRQGQSAASLAWAKRAREIDALEPQ